MTTVLFYYYIYNENGGVEYSIAVVGEDFINDYIVFDMIVYGGYVDFNNFMSSGYSLRSAGSTETLVATYAYDANGNRTSLTYANGTSTTYAYNKANLVTSIINKQGATTLSSHSYTYYLDGNIASENENGTTKTYEYDGIGRLTKETKNGTITSYTYDLNGNRATMTQNGVTTTYTYDENNRLESETAAGVATTYTYDNNGNLVNAWNGGNPVGAYSYNLFGNQVSYTPDGVVFTNYTYRPDGLRHSIGDKVHVWDGANIVADVDGNEVVVYIRGINLIYADDGDKIYYHFNAHGDVVVLTNESGTKTKSYSYNAFGVEYNEATLDNNPFRYCGEYYDKETKTIYLRARYYDSAKGRFTQEDTHWTVSNMIYGDDPNNTVPDQNAIKQSGNLYVYCGNNPVVFVDLTGDLYSRAEIHNFVLADITSRYDNMHDKGTYIEFPNGHGYCDLYNDQTGEVWEAKRYGNSPSCSKRLAKKQLNNYINNGKLRYNPDLDLKVGGTVTQITPNVIEKSDKDGEGVYQILYWDAGEGIIYYDYTYLPSETEVSEAAAWVCAAIIVVLLLYALAHGVVLPVPWKLPVPI